MGIKRGLNISSKPADIFLFPDCFSRQSMEFFQVVVCVFGKVVGGLIWDVRLDFLFDYFYYEKINEDKLYFGCRAACIYHFNSIQWFRMWKGLRFSARLKDRRSWYIIDILIYYQEKYSEEYSNLYLLYRIKASFESSRNKFPKGLHYTNCQKYSQLFRLYRFDKLQKLKENIFFAKHQKKKKTKKKIT